MAKEEPIHFDGTVTTTLAELRIEDVEPEREVARRVLSEVQRRRLDRLQKRQERREEDDGDDGNDERTYRR